MSVLESLRKRSGLLVAIVGLALLAFVLTGLFENGNSLFGGGRDVVGEIAGKEIKYAEFNSKVQVALEERRRSMQKASLSQQEVDEVVQQTWNRMINAEVFDKEYEKLGISVSDDELYDLMVDHPHSALIRNLSDQQTGQIFPQFVDEKTGGLSPAKIRQFTQNMTEEQERSWTQLEEYIRQVRINEKYANLIKKGLYVTKSAAKRDFAVQNTNANIRYVYKNYRLVADSTIKPSEDELTAYYNAHQNEYKQEASRKVEYIAYDIVPSPEDMEDAKKEMEAVANEFRSKTTTEEDSSFVIAESNSRYFDKTWHTPGTLGPIIDTAMFKAAPGTVMGPYEENGAYIISKKIAEKTSADSAKVRHILIAYAGSGASQTVTRNKEQASKLADSLVTALKKGGNFTALVDKFSDDGGKNVPPGKKETDDYTGKGGNYGWLNAKSGFVEPFKDAGLDGKKGDIVKVESQFGYHIMEVLDSKGQQKKVQVVNIDRKVEPSSTTVNNNYRKASEFASKNNTNDLFQAAVISEKLNKRIADNIKEGEKNIAGLENPGELVRWAYDAKKGDVSAPIDFGNKIVVAVLADVREKGIAPLEQVRDQVVAKVIQQKKAEMFSKEFEAALAGGAAIDAVGAKMKLPVETAENVNFNTNAIPGSSSEPKVMGVVSALKAKTMSKPIAGKEGVFLVFVESVTPAAEQKDYKAQQTASQMQIAPRADYEPYEALKEKAEISEHLSRFPFGS